MDSERVTAASLTAQTLDAAAREHKRQEKYHRRRAREIRRQHADFTAELKRHGITLIQFDDTAEEAQS